MDMLFVCEWIFTNQIHLILVAVIFLDDVSHLKPNARRRNHFIQLKVQYI
jgi:hypothetical protein